MAKHDLTGALESTFTFSINGLEFSFRKPTTREAREIGKKFRAVQELDNDEARERAEEEATNEMYKFITPVGHENNIGDVLLDAPVDVSRRFGEMVTKELGM